MECTVERSGKAQKLLNSLTRFIVQLEGRVELGLHQQVDQFYYMTKAEELRFLLDQFEENRKKQELLCAKLSANYSETFLRWQKDARWTNLYISQLKKSAD